MQIKNISAQTIQQQNTETTLRLLAKSTELKSWLEGVHEPSEGGFLEHLIREDLRKAIPSRFKVSTGFIAQIQSKFEGSSQILSKLISRQFDIIIWDSSLYPALFEEGDLVIINPISCLAVIEVTKSLSYEKLKTDLSKLDDLNTLFGTYEKIYKYPYTSIICLKSQSLNTVLKQIDKYYTYESNENVILRYQTLKDWPLISQKPQSSIPGFLKSVCSLEDGLINSTHERFNYTNIDYNLVKYSSYEHTSSIKDSYGILLKDIVFNLTSKTERDEDLYRAYVFQPYRAESNHVYVHNWSMPLSINTFNQCINTKNKKTSKSKSDFVVCNHTTPNPDMYWNDARFRCAMVVEQLTKDMWIVGRRDFKKGRLGVWKFIYLYNPYYMTGTINFKDGKIFDQDKCQIGTEQDLDKSLPQYFRDQRQQLKSKISK